MLEHVLSRRTFLAATGLSVAALLTECNPPPPTSPFLLGPYQTRQAILGETPGTVAAPRVIGPGDIPIPVDSYNFDCVGQGGPNPRLVPVALPERVLATVHYPADPNLPADPLNIAQGPFPILLYAHGLRSQDLACTTPFPIHRDFTRVDVMLQHVATYGCVTIAPDLSWLPGDIPGRVTLDQAVDLRARVLLGYFQHLLAVSQTVFRGQLDLNRVVLVGHSTGGQAATRAGRMLSSVISLDALAYGLLGPYNGHRAAVADPAQRNIVTIQGSLDSIGDGPAVHAASGGPKTLVTVPGANHFGYTHLCQLDNSCEGVDVQGAISRTGQQQTAAAYLTALLRHYVQGDATARPYLTGERIPEGLEIHGVTGIQVQQSGL
jgi:hypothetical protein